MGLGPETIGLLPVGQPFDAARQRRIKAQFLTRNIAETLEIAEDALKLIEVEYELLPPVLDVREAMRDTAPILNDDVRTEVLGTTKGPTGSKPTNVAKHFLFEKGEIAKGFAAADLVIEREFDTAMVHQGYIEPHNATVLWNPDGKITVWMSTQGSFSARQQTAELLRVPISNVKVIPMEIGGGFGGKISIYLPPVAALLLPHRAPRLLRSF